MRNFVMGTRSKHWTSHLSGFLPRTTPRILRMGGRCWNFGSFGIKILVHSIVSLKNTLFYKIGTFFAYENKKFWSCSIFNYPMWIFATRRQTHKFGLICLCWAKLRVSNSHIFSRLDFWKHPRFHMSHCLHVYQNSPMKKLIFIS